MSEFLVVKQDEVHPIAEFVEDNEDPEVEKTDFSYYDQGSCKITFPSEYVQWRIEEFLKENQIRYLKGEE